MNSNLQSDIFRNGEDDKWFLRNLSNLEKDFSPEDDRIISVLKKLKATTANTDQKFLEVGCGGGSRLNWIKNNLAIDAYGIDPSVEAVEYANNLDVSAKVGTAEQLTFPDNSFVYLVFGFCLYLCDRKDLFLIASEADRVLKDESYLIIYDLFFPTSRALPYRHREGIFTHKMDYRKLWNWNPNYLCVSHQITSHKFDSFSNDLEEWVAISDLKKAYNDK